MTKSELIIHAVMLLAMATVVPASAAPGSVQAPAQTGVVDTVKAEQVPIVVAHGTVVCTVRG